LTDLNVAVHVLDGYALYEFLPF